MLVLNRILWAGLTISGLFSMAQAQPVQPGSKPAGSHDAGIAEQVKSKAARVDVSAPVAGGRAESRSLGAWDLTDPGRAWDQLAAKLAGKGIWASLSSQSEEAALAADGKVAGAGGSTANQPLGLAFADASPSATTSAALGVSSSHVGSFIRGQSSSAYTLSVQNIGATATSGAVSAVDTLSAGFGATAISGPGWACTLATTTCTRSDALASGASYPPVTLTVSVPPNAPSQMTNQVSVSGGGSATGTASDLTNILFAFNDVSSSDLFLPAIDLMWEYSITSGCGASPPAYCPNDNVTEAQMAVFIVRSVLGTDNFTYTTTPYFSDVPASNHYFPWIQKMQDLGIALPCGANQFCPDTPVTRGIMAVLIIRGRYGVPTPANYPATPYFTDAGTNHPYYPWIQKMRQLGITSGCDVTKYCPDDQVTRGQMAVFIMRGSFNQVLPATTPVVVWASPASAGQGQTMPMTIMGQNTNFSSLTQVDAGAGITVSNVNVTNATTLTAQFTVGSGAAMGPRSITVTTGNEEATWPNGFRVQPSVSAITVSRTSLSYQLVTGYQDISIPINVLAGTGNVDFTVSKTGDTWLSVPTSGRTPGVVTIRLSSEDRAAGVLNGSVRITPAGGGTPQDISVSLTILATAAVGGAPQIVALDADDLLWGTSGSFGIYGQNLDGATGISISPSQGITVDSVSSSSSSRVNMNLAVSATAVEGVHTITVTTSRGTSSAFPFTVRRGQPQIRDLGPTVVNPGRFYSSADNFESAYAVPQMTFGASGVDLTGIGSFQVDPPDGITALPEAGSPGAAGGVLMVADSAPSGTRRLSVVTPAGRTNELTFDVRPPSPNAPVISNLTLNSTSESRGDITYSGKFDFQDANGDLMSGANLFLMLDIGTGAEAITLVVDNGSYLNQQGKTSGTISFSFDKSFIFYYLELTGKIPVACMVQDAAGNLSNTLHATVSTWDIPVF